MSTESERVRARVGYEAVMRTSPPLSNDNAEPLWLDTLTHWACPICHSTREQSLTSSEKYASLLRDRAHFPAISYLSASLESKSNTQLQDYSSTVLMFHAELETSSTTPPSGDPTQYTTFLNSRPQKLETDAIELIISLHKSNPSLRFHIVHLSAADALPLIREAKRSGINLTVETCFHYLCLASQSIPHGRPEFKCCPPIRDEQNRELLWKALLDGTIDFVVSDHSPCVAELKKLKEGDVMGAWGGISTLGLGLSLLWTEATKRGINISNVVEWMSGATAKHGSVGDLKGALKKGYDADFFVWDPEAEFEVSVSRCTVI